MKKENGYGTDSMYVGNLFKTDPNTIEFGKNYEEKICVKNTGNIDIFVRAIIELSWLDSNGNKDNYLNPQVIDIDNIDENWLIDESQSTNERIVMYYKKNIPVGQSSTNFVNNINIDSYVTNSYEIEEETTDEGKIITMKNKFDNHYVNLDIKIDAVQTHNAVDVIKSAWGIDVTLDDEGNILSIE